VWIAFMVLAIFQAAFTYLPQGQGVFGTAALGAASWAAVAAGGAILYAAVEIEKTVTRRLGR
jgi:hypothetical protein